MLTARPHGVVPLQVFRCPACERPVYFHNTRCSCGQQVAFDPETQTMGVAEDTCVNRDKIGCNWVAESSFCRSCAMTRTVPDLGAPENLGYWRATEYAKRWMLANLGRWGWFGRADKGDRPVFLLLSEQTSAGEANVTMGHANGTITINVTESDEAVRAERRVELGELYRTMLGHMRHEMAHFLQLRLARDEEFTTAFRELFGDEREDYGAALKRHYQNPQPPDGNFISSYATSHPHEDWAETVAHLLHLVDVLDSAMAVALTLPGVETDGYDAYAQTDTEAVLNRAVQISIAVNHVNRAVDLPDLYPFVLTKGVREKLALAHRSLRQPA